EPQRAPRPNELVIGGKDEKQLRSALRQLDRRAQQEFVDKGLWILYLGFGFLRWRDPEADELVESPLVLYPVTLARESTQEPFRLRAADEDPLVNPALALKLQSDFGVVLPGSDEFDDTDPSALCAEVQRRVSANTGWSVHERLVL